MPQTPLMPAQSQRALLDSEPITPTDSLYGLIWISPDRVSGAPCFAGTRVPVQHLLDYLESGESLTEFLEGFPGVTREQAIGVLEVAFRRLLDGLSHK